MYSNAKKHALGLYSNKFSKFTREPSVASRDLVIKGSVGDHCRLSAADTDLDLVTLAESY